MGTSEGILRCNGADLAYRMDGPAGRPILLFSNSLASDMSIWDDQVAALKSDYRIVRYDTRGHGRSPVVDGPLTIDDLASDAIALIEQLACWDRCISSGSRWAACWARRWPRAVPICCAR